jgi:hypothetical protein
MAEVYMGALATGPCRKEEEEVNSYGTVLG